MGGRIFRASVTPLAWSLAAAALAWAGALAVALVSSGESPHDLAPEALIALAFLTRIAWGVGLALAAVVALAARFRPIAPRLPLVVALLAVLQTALAVGLATWPVRVGRAKRPDVLLIVVDTLREDYVTPERTPHMLAIGARGLSFANAYATSPWTLPSFGSLLTGRHPRDHGAGVDPDRELGSGRGTLRPDVETLAERLKGLGYRTASVTSNPWLARASGLARGFDRYRNLTSDGVSLPGSFSLLSKSRFAAARLQTERALWTLRLRDPDHPLLLMVHYMDPHTPRLPPRAWLARERASAPASDVEVRYGASVRYVDHEVGRLLRGLERGGGDEGTVVVLTADHGEGLEVGTEREGHGNTLYPELVRIPLLIKPSGSRDGAARCDGLVSLVDVGSTILRLVGSSRPLGEGRTAVTALGLCGPPRTNVFQSMPTKPPVRDALVSATEGVIWAQPDRWRSYDRAADPDYRSPRRGAALPRMRALRGHVRRQRALAAASPRGPDLDLSAAQAETLRALGYLE